MAYLLDTEALEYFRAHPFKDGGIPTKLLDALVMVASASDHNVQYPNSPLGRADTIDALKNLQHQLEEHRAERARP